MEIAIQRINEWIERKDETVILIILILNIINYFRNCRNT